jgi:carbamoyl-phosphate synthase large subunit
MSEPEFADRRMLFLPGGAWQVPVIRLARRMGFRVTCADGTVGAPGFAAADEGIRVCLQDVAALVAIGRERAVDVVMTEQTDFAVPLVAQVAAALGLRGLPPAVAEAATNKRLMRQRVGKCGVRQPGFRECRTPAEALAAADELGLPLFHKPVDGQSSRGVGVLSSRDPASVAAALERSLAASSKKAAIFEQQLRGTECTVEGFVADGQPVTLAISDKEHYPDLPGVARTLTYPADFPAAVLRRIAEANEAAVRAVGVTTAITHAEFMVDAAGEPWLVELAARGGGSFITTHIVPAVTGFEPVPALMRALMGRPVEPQLYHRRGVQLRFLRLPAGRRVQRYANLEVLRQRPGVLELLFHIPEGSVIPPVADDRGRHGLVLTHADSRREAVAIADDVERSLDIVLEA